MYPAAMSLGRVDHAVFCMVLCCQVALAVDQLPLYTVTTAASWPKPAGDVFHGDIRARVEVPANTPAGEVRTQIFWRRRDPHPEVKGVIVMDSSDVAVSGAVPILIEQACGIVAFQHKGGSQDTTYYVYYLPYIESGGGAQLHFHWYNCTGEGPNCTLYTKTSQKAAASSISSDACASQIPLAPGVVSVTGLENRPNRPANTDRTSSGEPFSGYTPMEFIALPSEISSLRNSLDVTRPFTVFMETRENMVRMFTPSATATALPAVWARLGSERLSLSATAMAGEFFTFQIGVWAHGASNVTNVRLSFSDLVPTSGGGENISSTAFNCFNLGGTDFNGKEFAKDYGVRAGAVGSMWIGVDLPAQATATGAYTAVLSLSADGSAAPVELTLQLTVDMPSSGTPLTDHGDSDVYNLSRLRWLDSTLGIDDDVTAPFTNLTVSQDGDYIHIGALNKNVTIGPLGLPSAVTVAHPIVRKGVPSQRMFDALDSSDTPSDILIFLKGASSPVKLLPTTTPQVVSATASLVQWTATAAHVQSGLLVSVSGEMDFTSHLTYTVNVSTSGASIAVDDVRLGISLPPGNATARFMAGANIEGQAFDDVNWVWSPEKSGCSFWMGRAEAGVYVRLTGTGPDWDSPQFGKDYPVIPSVPITWGGVNPNVSVGGVNITRTTPENTFLAFSGPRVIHAGVIATPAASFKFELMFTPSKPLNLDSHWQQRYLQVGYGGVQYQTPQEIKDDNVTVVTLHQGIGGVFNGTMVNPYINWPFVPKTVEFMENFTAQAHDLGLIVKFYYTVRELTNHAAELFALKALDGELLVDASPYTVPQAGYCHDWDCHGGDSYLHEHLVNDYVQCWQQGLSNGDHDAAVCDIGVSRWFNYYIEGAYYSVKNAPHIDGIYYDGINFDHHCMRRVRKLLDRASQGKKHRPLIDIHTGEVSAAPSAVRYMAHFPYADSAWNGEGFQFGSGPAYWLVDVSGFIHGIPSDRLGGSGLDAKGMLFAQYQRNSGTAKALWAFWDSAKIEETSMIGWWEDDCPVQVAEKSSTPTKNVTCSQDMHGQGNNMTNAFWTNSGGASGVIGFGFGCGEGAKPSYPNLTVDEAIATCCTLGSECAAFSIAAAPSDQKSHGCFKKNIADGISHLANYNGFRKSASAQGQCGASDLLATVYSKYGSHAIVAVGSWCQPKAVSMHIDYDSLGLTQGNTVASAPLIPGVQEEADLGDGTEPFAVQGSGLIIVLKSKTRANL
eukprot:m.914684 g.914684  ORF g.914684 m.914684 type:complete len:1236 (+) comp23730_c1_seq7:171-3878(+)